MWSRVEFVRSFICRGSWTIDKAHDAAAGGVYLLFAAGKRPDRNAIRNFAQSQHTVSISHDPSDDLALRLVPVDEPHVQTAVGSPCDQSNSIWLELLREGLTFDLCGLAPGPTCEVPQIDHRFDLAQDQGLDRFDAVRLLPGHHLSGGQGSLPVARGMIGLACDLTHHFKDLLAVVWPPSASAIGRRFFESTATAWIEGGAFPALGLTAFHETMHGALESVGLDYWIGQELRIEQPLSQDRVAATRLGVRLVNQLVLIGALESSERVVAPDGSRLVMQPTSDRRFIRVWRE